jgi:hypothetical protein
VNRIIISDEKLFIVQENLKAQNDRVYAATIEDIPQQIGAVQHLQKPGSMMICGSCPLSLVLLYPSEKAMLRTTGRQFLIVA